MSRNWARSPRRRGWRKVGRSAGSRSARADKSSGELDKYYRPVRGYHFLHTVIDAHSRLAYSELLGRRTQSHRRRVLAPTHGSPSTASLLKKVLTDNGSCYRSHAFRDALGEIKHRRTRPYRPQTNGKVERFHRTLADEWAYARLYTSDLERCDEFPRWLHTYNHHRGHTALGGQPPATRIPNLSGQYI